MLCFGVAQGFALELCFVVALAWCGSAACTSAPTRTRSHSQCPEGTLQIDKHCVAPPLCFEGFVWDAKKKECYFPCPDASTVDAEVPWLCMPADAAAVDADV